MTAEEILLRRLAGQHLLLPTDTQTVVKDLCGVQAQFLSHTLHGLSIRCHSVSTEGLIKSWTNRGTMHLFSADDLPLFLHQERSHFLRPVDTLEGDAFITASRKQYFVMVEAVAHGTDQREVLKKSMLSGRYDGNGKQKPVRPLGRNHPRPVRGGAFVSQGAGNQGLSALSSF